MPEDREENVSLLVNGAKPDEQKSLAFSQSGVSAVLRKENYQHWDFRNLNMLFGTDAQPFVTFVSPDAQVATLGVKSNMSLRNHQSVVRLDAERLVFAGGVNYLFNHVTGKTFEYNIRTSKYRKMGSLINRRFFAQLVLTRGRLFVVGGRDYGNDEIAILGTCEEYNFGTNQWVQTASLNFPRCNFSALVFRDDIFVFSGLTKTSALLNSIERFNFDKGRWEVLGLQVTEDMLGNLSFSRGDEIVILGGTRSWGPGAVVRLDLSHGADLGETSVKKVTNKNALSKPVVLERHVLGLGGFFSHNVLFDKKALAVVDDAKELMPYKDVIDHIERLCMQSFRLTKCSFVLPLDNAGNALQSPN